jgi:hypothetical protein
LQVGSCYVMTNTCQGGMGGYKTEPNWDGSGNTWDYWLVKFCDSTATSSDSSGLISDDAITVFPNPFSNHLIIRNEGQGTRNILLCDMQGKILLQQKAFSAEAILNVEGIAAGFYLLKIDDRGDIRNYKVMKVN